MRVLLSIFAGLFILFFGGCAFLLASNGGVDIALLWIVMSVVAAFNLALLIGLWSRNTNWLPAFYILSVLDILASIGLAVFSVSVRADQYMRDLWWVVLVAAGFFLAKGLLTLIVARKRAPE